MVVVAYVGANVGPFGTHPLVIRLAFIPGIIGSELALHYVMFMSSITLFLWKIQLFENFQYLTNFSLSIMIITSVHLIRTYARGFEFSAVSKKIINDFYLKTHPKSKLRHHSNKKKKVSSQTEQVTNLSSDDSDDDKKKNKPSPTGLISRLKSLLKSIIDFIASQLKEGPTKPSSHLEEPSMYSPLYWFKLLIPIPSLHFPYVQRIRDIAYANDDEEYQRLDLFFHSACSSHRPILVYIHGGGWKQGGGKRSTCGLPLIYQMASKHWIVFSIGYRLAPNHKFPMHIHDIKKAIQWIRENAQFYGGDIDSMFLAGGSAGGHMASLTALTDGIDYDELFFEDLVKEEENKENVNNNEIVNEEEKEKEEIKEPIPSVIMNDDEKKKKVYPPFRGCVSYYAVYDFTNREKAWSFDFPFYLGDVILRNTIEKEPSLYTRGSPLDHIHETTNIPFLVFHGDHDELVPMKESIQFVDKYLDVVGPKAKVTWMPVPGAHHAFDLLFSPRTIYSVYSTYRYLNRLYKLHQHERLKLKLSRHQKLQQQRLDLLEKNADLNSTNNQTPIASV